MSAAPGAMQACSGLKVLDLAHGYGAITGMVLADFGAEVVKVEPPSGDTYRSLPAFRQWNRGKRGIVVDLNRREDVELVRELASRSDVLIENFRPGVADRLGVGYEALAERNPAVVYLAISGFPAGGKDRGLKGYEGIVAARCGQFLIQNGYRQGGPIYDAVNKSSFGASMLGLIGIMAALRVQESTGRGQKVDTSLVQANFIYSYGGLQAPTPELMSALNQIQGRDPHNVMPGYRIARCADGQWIQSGSAAGRIFDNLMQALGIDEWFTDPRFGREGGARSPADNAYLLSLIDRAYASKPLSEWRAILDSHDAAYAEFSTTQEFMDNPQVLHNGHVISVQDPEVGPMLQIGPLMKLDGVSWEWPGPAPALGQHTDAIRKSVESTERPPAANADRALPARPLENITIIDLSTFAASPGGPGLLADLGARVIKIEPPSGDPLGAGRYGGSELFFRVNRGKERITLDLKDLAGQAILHRLVAQADVVLHNFRPGVTSRIGADFPTLQAINDRLVYVYGASFGSTGPDAQRPAFDAVMSAMAGGEVLQAGRGNPPQQRQTTDHSALLGVAIAILLGLRRRDLTGAAQQIETTMLASAAYLFSDDFLRYEGKPDRAVPDSGQYGLHALYRLYRTSDDGWAFLACSADAEWIQLCEALGHGEWTSDERFGTCADRAANDEELVKLLEAEFVTRPTSEWERLLLSHDVACVDATHSWANYLYGEEAGVPEEDLVDYEISGIGRVRQPGPSVNLRRTPGKPGRPQRPGASTRQILTEIGMQDQIDDLIAKGIVSAAM